MKQSVIGLKIARLKKSQNKSSARIMMNRQESKEVLNQIQNEAPVRRKNNQSSVLGQMSSGGKQLKKSNSKKITVKFSSPILNNSPKLQSKNIHQLLECLDGKRSENDDRGVYISHDIAKMLKALLKNELEKINAKERRSPARKMKRRKASVAELEPIPDEPELEIKPPKEAWNDKAPRYTSREPYKQPINVSIHHNVGNVCYAPVFIGNNRNTSKDASESNIKMGISVISSKPHCTPLVTGSEKEFGRDGGI